MTEIHLSLTCFTNNGEISETFTNVLSLTLRYKHTGSNFEHT